MGSSGASDGERVEVSFDGIELAGYASALVLGALMGSVGGGGAILSVPVFVYAFSIPPAIATQYSLWVVAVAAWVGLIPYFKMRLVNVNLALILGLPSFLGVWLGRRWVLPGIPQEVALLAGYTVSRDQLLMLLFALLMLGASRAMLRRNSDQRSTVSVSSSLTTKGGAAIQGVLLGLVTGVLGAGGGFLIVPLLVSRFAMAMKLAVGTSLLMIALNSTVGFAFGLKNAADLDWRFLLSFSALAVVGILIGTRVSTHLNGDQLKRGFGLLVWVLAVGILITL
jgi:uncharacterized membrane protein YfcA